MALPATAKTDEALPLARLAVDLAPENADILDTLAQILVRRGERGEAIKWMEKAARLDARYSSAARSARGSWGSDPTYVRASNRVWNVPTLRNGGIGFRCAGELR